MEQITFEPQVDAGLCSGCGQCVEVCNHEVLRLQAGVAAVRAGRYCNGCGSCLALCPEGALAMEGLATREVGERPTPEAMEGLMARRRSVRHFRAKAVPKEMVERLIQAAAQAPTGCNSRSPHYTVLQDPAEVERMGRWFQRLSAPVTLIWGHSLTQALLRRIPLIFARKASNSRLIQGMNALRTLEHADRNWVTLGAPAMIVLHADPAESTPHEDCSIAATQMILMAEALGLGTCFNGVLKDLLNGMAPWRRKLRIPRGHQIYTILCVGYPSVRFLRGLARQPASVTWIGPGKEEP